MKLYLTPKTLKKIIKMLVLFILACILIYFSNTLNVKAYTISNNSIYVCDSSDNVTTGKYNYITDGVSYTANFGTTYQGVMTSFSTRFNAQIQQGNSYTLVLNSNTGDWRNIDINSIKVLGSIGSHCSSNINAYTITSVTATYYKITITFTANSTANYTQIVIYNSDGSAITGISNFKIDSMVLTDLGNSNTSDIINNQNQTTQTIIENDKQNTQDIIENDKENTQDIIDNQDKNNEELKEEIQENFNTCYTNIFDATSYKSNTFSSVSVNNNDVTVSSTSSWKTLTYEFNVEVGEQYTLYYEGDDNIGVYYYNGSGSNDNFKRLINSTFTIVTPKTNILTIRLQNIDAGTTTFSNLLLVKGVTSTFIPFGQEVCSNKLDNITGGLNDLNENQQATNDKLDEQLKQDHEQHEETMDTITDSSDPDLAVGDTAGWLPPGPVDSVLNLPLTILNSLISNLSNKTCSSVDVPLPYIDKSLQLPCLSTIFEKTGFTDVLNTISIPFAIFIYINTLIKLYGWVDKTLQFREEHWNDVNQWGGI